MESPKNKNDNEDIAGVVESTSFVVDTNEKSPEPTKKIVVNDANDTTLKKEDVSPAMRKSASQSKRDQQPSPLGETRLDQNDTEKALFNPGLETHS